MKTSLFESASALRGASRTAATVLAALCLFLSVGLLSAQEYKEASVDDGLAGQKASTIGSNDSAKIKDFLTKYYLARWTVRDNGREIHKYVAELESDAPGQRRRAGL